MDERNNKRTFDPRPYLRTITTDTGETEYLDIRWRLAWLRTDHPNARITTEHVVLNEDSAVFRAMVTIPDGGCATGYGSETRTGWEDFIEKAETKAIGRALAGLGYGTQFAIDFESAADTAANQQDTERPATSEKTESQPRRTPSTPQRSTEPLPGNREEWDEFWRWARSIGYMSRQQLEEVFEHSLDGMTPREVREELTDYLQRNNLTTQGGGEPESM